MRPVVLDANVFKVIYEDLVNLCEGDGFKLLEGILANDVIVVDERDVIIAQWKNCCCGEEDEFFSQWIATAFIEDKLRRSEIIKDRNTKKYLLNELVLPKDDLIYLLLAIATSAFLVVSEDIHLYEPSAKKKDSGFKRRIILERSGCICRYMKKEHSVLICCIDHAKSLLCCAL
jgi:hypothetical protein